MTTPDAEAGSGKGSGEWQKEKQAGVLGLGRFGAGTVEAANQRPDPEPTHRSGYPAPHPPSAQAMGCLLPEQSDPEKSRQDRGEA